MKYVPCMVRNFRTENIKIRNFKMPNFRKRLVFILDKDKFRSKTCFFAFGCSILSQAWCYCNIIASSRVTVQALCHFFSLSVSQSVSLCHVTVSHVQNFQNIPKVQRIPKLEFVTTWIRKRILKFVRRVISVFRVISPDFKRWLHFLKLGLVTIFIVLSLYSSVQ